jgi:hypothetical protein
MLYDDFPIKNDYNCSVQISKNPQCLQGFEEDDSEEVKVRSQR